MTGADDDEQSIPRPPLDEVGSKRIGRKVRESIEFREEVFARDPDSGVSPETAAAVLGLKVEALENELAEGRLRFFEVEGQPTIRVADLRAAFEEQTARLDKFSQDWTELRSKLDWDE